MNNILENFNLASEQTTVQTQLVKVLNYLRLNADSGNISVLNLLDFSSTFDTIDHNILLNCLEKWVGLSGTVLRWFQREGDSISEFGEHISEMVNIDYDEVLKSELQFNVRTQVYSK